MLISVTLQGLFLFRRIVGGISDDRPLGETIIIECHNFKLILEPQVVIP